MISAIKPTNGISNLLPNQAIESNVIFVEVRTVFLVLHDIDTLNERFTADLFIESKWPYDEKIEKIGDFTKIDDTWKPKWVPEFKITNTISEYKSEIWYKIAEIDEKIFIFEMKRLKGTFYERLELQNYPFDVQKLNIDLISTSSNSKCLLFKSSIKPSRVIVENFHDSQEWHLYDYVGVNENGKLFNEYSIDETEHSKISFYCAVARKPRYFCWNAFYLIFIISAISFSTYSISYTQTTSRLQSIITLLLTSVSFKWVINRSLPAIAYLTTLDIYSIFAISFMSLITCSHAIIGIYASKFTHIDLDNWLLIAAGIVYVTAHVVFLLWLLTKGYGPRRYYSNLEKSYATELELNNNSNKEIKIIRPFSKEA